MRLHIQEYFPQVGNVLQPFTIDCQSAVNVLGWGLVLASYQWRVIGCGLIPRGPIGATVDANVFGPVVFTLAPQDGSAEKQLISACAGFAREMNRLILPNWTGKLDVAPVGISIRPAGAADAATPLLWFDLAQVGTESDPYLLAASSGAERDAFGRGKFATPPRGA